MLRSRHLAADSQVPEGEIQKHLEIQVLKPFQRLPVHSQQITQNAAKKRESKTIGFWSQKLRDHLPPTCSRSSGGKSNREDKLPSAAMDWYFWYEKNSGSYHRRMKRYPNHNPYPTFKNAQKDVHKCTFLIVYHVRENYSVFLVNCMWSQLLWATMSHCPMKERQTDR